MNKIMLMAPALVLSALCGAGSAVAQTADSAAYRSATDQIASDYKNATAQCHASQGNAHKVCIEQAKADRAHAQSDAVAQYKNTPQELSQARANVAKADYALASAKCADATGPARSSCLSAARDAEQAALADAKAGKQSGTSSSGASGSVNCNQTETGAKAACMARTGAESAKKVIDDSVITAKIKADLIKAPDLTSSDVHVETVKGVVMLTGSVPSADQIDQVAQLARKVDGVTDVKNDLQTKQ